MIFRSYPTSYADETTLITVGKLNKGIIGPRKQGFNGTFLNGRKRLVLYHLEIIQPLNQITLPLLLLQNWIKVLLDHLNKALMAKNLLIVKVGPYIVEFS